MIGFDVNTIVLFMLTTCKVNWDIKVEWNILRHTNKLYVLKSQQSRMLLSYYYLHALVIINSWCHTYNQLQTVITLWLSFSYWHIVLQARPKLYDWTTDRKWLTVTLLFLHIDIHIKEQVEKSTYSVELHPRCSFNTHVKMAYPSTLANVTWFVAIRGHFCQKTCHLICGKEPLLKQLKKQLCTYTIIMNMLCIYSNCMYTKLFFEKF